MRVFLFGFLFLVCCPILVHAQEFVVFKVYTPFDMGDVKPGSARVNDFYVKLGIQDGIQVGTVMNVYRDKEIVSDVGNFTISDRVFIGRLRTINAQREHSVGRVTLLAKHKDPHRILGAVLIGDYVQPVFVVESENLFDSGSNTLRPEAIRELDRAVAFVKRFRAIKTRIEGHTDSGGGEDYNMTLSLERATSVKDYLVSQGGIASDSLVPVGYGEAKPIASNENQEGRRKNRRFEIVIER